VRLAFQTWFRLTRGLTLGARAMVRDDEGRILLVRHTYVPGWAFPGGGVERGETAEQALAHELKDEAGVILNGRPRLFALYANNASFPGDHIAFYLVEPGTWERIDWKPNREIADARFFPPDALPGDLTPGTAGEMADPFDLDDFDDGPTQAAGPRPLSAQAAAAARPVLVLAGAGTGKTRVLTTRLAWILAAGLAWPGQILAVTFTNKAAREMKERIGRLIGGMVEGMTWLGTFHSIGVKILQRHAELAGLKSGFSILDTDDQLRLLKQVMEAEGIDDKRHPARQMAGLIDDWKNRGLAPDDLPEAEAAAFAGGRAGAIYASYQRRLKEINAVDFGDLLLEPLRLLRANSDLLEDYRRRFRYMLVDEYQDTNVAQYMLLRLLAGKDGNICCVGDDDQSIYGWRGAQVENILRFERDFPGARIIRLERNYRSTAHILAAASHLISHNRGRLGKTLRSQIGDGEKVILRAHWDDAEEARAIADDLEALRRAGGRLSGAAVLVRATFQMRALEERFIEIGLPYRVIGGPRFYERLEVRDALAYLRVIHSPDHDLAFERIINVPKRGIGAASVKKMHEFARMRGLSLYRAAELMLPDLPARARSGLKTLLADFARWRALVDTVPPSELAETVLDESGYAAMWKSDRSPKAQGRLENLKELVRSMEEFDTLAGFLEHVSLVMAADEAAETPAGLRGHHPGEAPRHHLFRPQQAGAQSVADRPALPFHRRAAAGARGGVARRCRPVRLLSLARA